MLAEKCCSTDIFCIFLLLGVIDGLFAVIYNGLCVDLDDVDIIVIIMIEL